MKTLRTGILLVCLLAAGVASAADPVLVRFAGQTEPVTGYLREISQSRYILQSDEKFYEFAADDLISVDGKAIPDREDLGSGRLVYTTMYERVLPTGDVEIWTNLDIENSGSSLIESVDWGAAEWELEETRTMEVRDPYGTLLPVEITARDSGGYRVEVALPVPVAPMESVSLSVKRIRREAARATADGGWSYTFNVDFNEDRLFVRKVEFPRDARVRVPEGWWRNEVGGRQFLHSYFYYPARTVTPQVIEYRLN